MEKKPPTEAEKRLKAEKERIVKIINSNKKLSYEELKKMAIEAKLELYIFEDAWNSIMVKRTKAKKRRKILIIFLSVTLMLSMFFGFLYYTSSGPKLRYKGGGCAEIFSNEECKRYVDCNSVWERDEENEDAESEFKECENTPNPKMELSELCHMTYGYLSNGNCSCSEVKQSEVEREMEGRYVFMKDIGCVTEHEKCIKWKGSWGRYRVEIQDGWPGEGVQFIVVNNKYNVITEDSSQPFSCQYL